MESKLIGKGRYGQVYRPPTQGDHKGDDAYVMKIGDDYSITRELYSAAILRLLDPEYVYFSYPEDVSYAADDRRAIVSPYAGEHLEKTEQIFPVFVHLVKALQILTKARIYHNDITYRNIVFLKVPRIIDFGTAVIIDHRRVIEDFLKNDTKANYVSQAYPLWYSVYAYSINPKEELLTRYFNEYDEVPDEWLKMTSDEVMDKLIMPNLWKIDLYRLLLVIDSLIPEEYEDPRIAILDGLISLALKANQDPSLMPSVDDVLKMIS